MAITAKVLVESAAMNTVATTHYQSSALAIIDKFTLTNTSNTVSATVTCHLVPSAGSAGVSNVIISKRVLEPNETYTCPECVSHVLASGSGIAALSTSTAVNIRVSGREIT